MKKFSALLIALLFPFTILKAQYPHIGNDTTICSGHSVFLNGTQDAGTTISNYQILGDGYTNVLSLGFSFNFYGNIYTHFLVGGNGVINFDTSLHGQLCIWPISEAIPSATAAPKNSILFPWEDIGNSTIQYGTYGIAPHRYLVVQFCNAHFYSCNTLQFTGQVVLYEGTNMIETHIANKPVCTGWNNGRAIHGLQNSSGTLATVVPGRNYPTQWTAVNDGKKFTPNAGFASYSVSNIPFTPVPIEATGFQWTANGSVISTQPTMTVTPTQTTTYVLNITGGCMTFKDTLVVSVQSSTPPLVSYSGSNIICGAGSVLLTASASSSYQWKKNNVAISGATAQTYFVTATGSYTVTSVNLCGTLTSNAVQITKYNLPSLTLSASGSTSFCSGGSVTITATSNAGVSAAYQWYKSSVALAGATNAAYIATVAGTYKVTVINTLTTCSKTSGSVVVSLLDPTASISAGGPTTFCAGGSVLFSAVTNAGAGALFQWYKGSNALSGATNNTYTATLAGNYKVKVTNSSGCTKFSAIKQVVINCRLEDATLNNGINIFPNPSTGGFTIELSQPDNFNTLRVENILGQTIFSQNISGENSLNIDLSNEAKGVYILRLSGENTLTSKKIVIE